MGLRHLSLRRNLFYLCVLLIQYRGADVMYQPLDHPLRNDLTEKLLDFVARPLKIVIGGQQAAGFG
jgi:hypothetical protein